METLVAVARHRNQYYSRSRPEGPAGLDSPPSRSFREISCRTFQSGVGILPNPLKPRSSPRARTYCTSPQTPSSCAANPNRGASKTPTRNMKTASLPVNISAPKRETSFNEDFAYYELWAGPAYSNSPPPSSLPIPKFSLGQKRTVSLDLPSSAPVVKFHPVAKSAPASPTREPSPLPRDLFLTPDSATKTLRRILNLDITDE